MNTVRLLPRTLPLFLSLLACVPAHAQVNSGSNGSDGALNPTTNIVINMADHPNGIYHYTSVNIPTNVTVSFIPNANNTPVVWLVQSNVVVNGTISVSASNINGSVFGGAGTPGGPGGYAGGSAPLASGQLPSMGLGPGGGKVLANQSYFSGGNASFGGLGQYVTNSSVGYQQHPNGDTYGNIFLIPLVGGSGGSGGVSGNWKNGGGGGGGAILIAASTSIALNGSILAKGGGSIANSSIWEIGGGGGSGGAIRLLASSFSGSGSLDASGGRSTWSQGGWSAGTLAGDGRIRIDALGSSFGGSIHSAFTQGSQFIIFPTPGQGAQLTVTSVAGVPVSASPTGVLTTPDAVLSAQQNNPIPIVVHCSNIPLNTQITVSVKPANAPAVSATGLNTGTLASSTATIPIVIPRGGGFIYATAATSN